MQYSSRTLQLINTIGFVFVVVVNYLATALPIGGQTTGELSDQYPSLFTPAGFTFSIWGLIYLGLALVIIFQFRSAATGQPSWLYKIGPWFFFSCLTNIAWIFAWHYQVVWLSVLIMLVFLLILIVLYRRLVAGPSTSDVEKWLVRPIFTIYLAWITVATITNISTLLIDLGWSGQGFSDVYWTILMLTIGAVLGVAFTLRERTVFYALVLIWAYFGIWYKRSHTMPNYSLIETVSLIGIVVLVAAAGYVAAKRKGIVDRIAH